ncbi:type I secretion protein TolC [Massilia sp. Root351]|uniref:TolC family outer membrane protein n=1 Tax=Massilia sp. Root351 TaxID=1736522 RepID=UPI000710EF1D|nr:TolC family outer membrane protein [Massilia sp. Root351]KQV81015.1 type I secretion protein TolC [Massilia sp. Root351]
MKMTLKTLPAALGLARSLGLLLALHGGAVHGMGMDVAEAYRQALRNDPASLADEQSLAAGREKSVQGDALLRPRVNLQLGVNRLHNRQSGDSSALAALPGAGSGAGSGSLDGLGSLGRGGSSTGTTAQASVQLVQPVYDLGARASRRQLHEQTTLAQTQFTAARQQLALRVAQAYFGVLVAEETVRVVQAELAAVRQQRERAQARFDVGQDRITDVQEAQARLDAVTTREVSAQSVLELRRAQFRETTGTPPNQLAPLAARFVPRPPQPAALADWQARGAGGSTLVLARQSEQAIANAELSRHSLAGRPTLDLVASYGAKQQRGGLSPLVAPDGDRTASVGLMLNVPLYAGGALDSHQREAVARFGQAELQLAAAQRDVRLQVQEGYLAVTTGVSRVAAQEQALASARSALDATTRGRDVGTRTALDVLDAQQRLFSAELDLVQGRADYLLGRLRLAQAVGELDEDTLRGLGPWLER